MSERSKTYIKTLKKRKGLFLLSCLFLLFACSDTSDMPTPQVKSASTTPISNQTVPENTILPTASKFGNNNTIRIYYSLPIASDPPLFTSYSNAAKMAIDDFTQETGKIGAFNIDYVPLDDADQTTGQWNADLEKQISTRAASDPDAMVYLGPVNSGAAKISIPILNQAGLAMISPGASYPGLTRPSAGLTRAEEPDIYYPTRIHTFFRVVAPDDVQAPAIIEFLKSLKVKTVFLIDDSQIYGKGLTDQVEALCPKASLDCSHRTSISGKENGYAALAEGIKAVKPDAIFFGGLAQQQASKLLKDLRAAGIKAPFMGGGAIRYDLLIQEAGSAAEGAYAINSGTSDDNIPPKGQDFLKRYSARFGSKGLNSAFTRQGYEVMSVALTAIKQAGLKDRKAIVQALTNLKDFEGVLGKWSFDRNGDTTLTDFTVWQVINGEWKPLLVLKPNVNP